MKRKTITLDVHAVKEAAERLPADEFSKLVLSLIGGALEVDREKYVVERAPRTNKETKREANPEVVGYRDVVETYFIEFERVRGTKPKFTARDGKCVRELIETCGSSESARDVIKTAFSDPWFASKLGTLTHIVANVNKYVVRHSQSNDPRRQFI